MSELRTVNRKADYFVLLLAIGITYALVLLLEKMALGRTGGVFSYPVDDVYIHMELAKNLAFNNTWGINEGEFGSASSSPLYTVLLAGLFKFFSKQVYIPFVVNCVAGLMLLVVTWDWLRRHNVGSLGQFIVLMAVTFNIAF